jgi:hypothetical protein
MTANALLFNFGGEAISLEYDSDLSRLGAHV